MNDTKVSARQDLTRTVLSVLVILLLIAGAFWILRPFLLPVIWAMMIVVATWPLMLQVQARLRRRSLAVLVMSTAMVLVFVVPLLLAVKTVVENLDTIAEWVRSLASADLPPPPAWLEGVPLVGAKLSQSWANLAAAGKEELAGRLVPYAGRAAQTLAGALGGVGFLMVEFLLTVIIAVILFTNGEAAREWIIGFGRRLGGDRGAGVMLLAGQAIRGVALGVVVTALLQTLLAGLGLAVAGVPFAGLLTGVILLLCIAQIGPALVLIAAVVWLYWSDHPVAATGLLIWAIPVAMLDNVLRPILIRKGADLPLLLIFAGVIGGLLSFGIIGLFVGPVVLAVAYTLFAQWVTDGGAAVERLGETADQGRPRKR